MHMRSTKRQQNEVSIEEAITSDKSGNSITYGDTISSDGDEIADEVDAKMEISNMLRAVKNALTEREQTVVTLRYGLNGGDELTQKDIAKRLNISRSYSAVTKNIKDCKKTFTRLAAKVLQYRDN